MSFSLFVETTWPAYAVAAGAASCSDRLCLDYALYKHGRSVQRVADLNGVSEWVIYKWMSEGSIPSKRIRPFEFACDCTFITEHLCAGAQKLAIDIPRGREVDQSDLLALQTKANETVNQLARFYHGEAEAAEVLTTLTDAMTALAGHRANVDKVEAPELALFEGESE